MSLSKEQVRAIGFRGDDEKRGSWAGGGLVLGLVAGAIVGVAAVQDGSDPGNPDAWNWDLRPIGYLLGGGVLGWAIGSVIPVGGDEDVRVECR
jgi:hypothetical protein